jgi:hypothetical protein
MGGKLRWHGALRSLDRPAGGLAMKRDVVRTCANLDTLDFDR